MKVIDHKVEKVADEAGPVILGYPTRHYKFVTTMTTETTMMGRKQTNTSATEQELWTTTRIEAPGLAIWRKLQSQKTGLGDVDKVVEAERAKGIKGFPLKSINTSTSGNKGQPTKTTSEVTEIKEGAIDRAVFEIPGDYKEEKMEMPDSAGEGADKDGKASSPEDSKDPPSPVDAFLKSFNKKR
jgi:hypothetical protein